MNVTRLQPAEIPQIWHCLQQISDPELPVLSITDLGMVRDVERDGDGWRVIFTPTYSGCPATEFLLSAIEQRLTEAGFSPVQVDIRLSPAWTTDWMNAAARERLRQYGVAPPQGHTCDRPQRENQRVRFHRLQSAVSLPRVPRTLRLFQMHIGALTS